MHNPWLGMKGGPKTKEEFKRNWAVRQNHHASSGCFDFMKKWKAWCFSGSDAMGRSELGEDDLLSLWSLSAVKVGQCSFLRWVGQEAWGDWGEMNLINHSTTQSCSHLPAINTQLCFAINKIIFFRWRLTLCTQVWHDLVWFGIVTFYALPSFAR